MAQAAGVNKQLKYKVEATYGTKPAATAAQLLRRVTSDLSLAKDTYQGNEIRPELQVYDFRHGVRRVEGTIKGQLSPKTYAELLGFLMRRDPTAFTPLSGVSISVTPSGDNTVATVTRASGSWLTDGVKKGMVIRLGTGSLNAANKDKNLVVTGITNATTMSVKSLNGTALATDTTVTGCGVTAAGKWNYLPTTGFTNKSVSIEHWYSDSGVALSEVYKGCCISQAAIQLPPSGIATIDLSVVGQDVDTAGTEYFTSPTAATSTGLLAAANGVLLINGTQQISITGLNFTIGVPRSGDAVVGMNVRPALFPGIMTVSGQFTAYFESATLRDYFLNETEIDLMAAFSASNDNQADFISFYMPRIKVGGASKNDGEGGIIQTFPFTALLPTTGGTGIANELSTLCIQDSAA